MEKKVKEILDNMTIEDKVGQCLVIGFVGTVLTPKILERIRRIHPAGVRCATTMRMKDAMADPYAYNEERLDRVLRKPQGTVKDFTKGVRSPYTTNEEYCELLNTMKRASLESGAGIPLHITLDMEGEGGCYQEGGTHYFPSVMGISKSGDPKLAYEVGWAVAHQVTKVGFSWIHSPVCDVNTNPLNPEIGTRSFGETAKEALPYLLESFRGLRDGGLITTGKHFPGRGASVSDAHKGLPVINLSREEMEEHLETFKALIDEGLPCIMTAHTAYPQLDPSGLPATLSKTILTDLLKTELGFKGVITTDDITMGGIVERFEVKDACIQALNAGADLILFRDESALVDEVYEELVKAAKNGVIREERLNDAVSRTLSVKMQYGLFNDGAIKAVEEAGTGIHNPKVESIARKAAEKTVFVLKDEANILPLPRAGKKVLLVEQIHPAHLNTNTTACHPSLLWEKMFKYDNQIGGVETTLDFNEDDQRRVMNRIDDYDIIIITNYYCRRHSNGNEFVKKLCETQKPVIVVTNCPYSFTVQPEYKSVVISYGVAQESMETVAALLYGEKV